MKFATGAVMCLFSLSSVTAVCQPCEITFKIENNYIILPVTRSVERATMEFVVEGAARRSFVIRLAPGEPDYEVFADVSAWKGRTVTIKYEGDPAGLASIHQSGDVPGAANMYRESNRPRFHFTARRGWINDPNGLIYNDGEYHLFYQHNPYEREWENMHWGHAVSCDLVHWEELPEALYPDEHGTMFSGSAVIDYDNTAGYNRDGRPAMIAYYTAAARDRQTQCMAYSLDNGRTWTKYEGNPVIDSKEKWNNVDTRDPKIFWYTPGRHWVMVLYERDGQSIYTSGDLKNWTWESHVTGFFECPELFELPVDGDPGNTLWVMYGASGTYMLGRFDGRVFTPVSGKYYYTSGTIYAAQTFTNIPDSDGRRIQIGWGRVDHPGMPFKGMMLMPTELTLRTTKDGPRLCNVPVREMETIFTPVGSWSSQNGDEATAVLTTYGNPDCLRVRTTIELFHSTSAGLTLNGQRILDYDMNNNTVNGMFYSPEDMTSMELTADIYIDRTAVEVFIDGGAYSYSMERRAREGSDEGLVFYGNNITVTSLEVFSVESIW